MHGTARSIVTSNGAGLILGNDSVHYTYTLEGWRNPSVSASPRMKVDFEIRGTHALAIYPLLGSARPPAEHPSGATRL